MKGSTALTPQRDDSAALKIKHLDDLAEIVKALKSEGKKIVHCHGVFDLLHLGHIRHFKDARRHGDVLVVTITPDQWVNKGPGRPAFTDAHRAEVLASMGCIDYVAINKWPDAQETIRLLKPNVYAKGPDYRDATTDATGGISREQEAVESVGGELVITEDLSFSSSSLINRYMSTLSKEVSDFLAGFSKQYPVEGILEYLARAKSLKVLVIGETIIDEYDYCQALGKSGKEPILAVRFLSREKFAGGVLAVGNHVASFCESVSLYSFLGKEDTQEEFVRSKLSANVTPTFFYMEKAPTIVKRRFVESYPFQKMFEVCVMNEDEAERANSDLLCKTLQKTLPEFDLVIVTDYGHGMLGQPVIDVLVKHARCLAINTQANAANHGFNTVAKYPRADYVCISESEMRLEARQRRQDIQQIVENVAARLGCKYVVVTRGSQGLLCYSRNDGFITIPALSGHFTDRVGAGDAVLAVTSLFMAQDAPAAVLGLVGNAVGAIAVNTIGNRMPVQYSTLHKSIVALLK